MTSAVIASRMVASIAAAMCCLGCSDLEVRTALAYLGNSDAQFLVAEMHRIGVEGRTDPEAAEYWWLRAANAGNVISQQRLGVLYLNGNDESRFAEGVGWMTTAAESGSHEAQHYLAVMLFNQYRKQLSEGAVQTAADRRKWLSWFESAAKAGNVRAQSQLGLLYSLGDFAPLNRKRARLWLARAAEQGDAAAAENLRRLPGR